MSCRHSFALTAIYRYHILYSVCSDILNVDILRHKDKGQKDVYWPGPMRRSRFFRKYNFKYDAEKKGQLILVQKKFLRRVVEGLFLSNAGPKSGCL